MKQRARDRSILGPALLAILAIATMALAGDQPVKVLDDFDDADLTTAGGNEWFTYSDEVAGGKSTATVSIVPSSRVGGGHGLRIEGRLTDDFPYAYAGARGLLTRGGTPVDMRQYRGVRFWIRGDEDVYKLQVVIASVTDYNDYSKAVVTTGEWTQHEVLFTELEQGAWGRQVIFTGRDVRGIGFHTMEGALGDFWLEVDQIEFF